MDKAKETMSDLFRNYVGDRFTNLQILIDTHQENKFGNEVIMDAAEEIVLDENRKDNKTRMPMVRFLMELNRRGDVETVVSVEK